MFARHESDKPLHLGLTAHCGLCGTALEVGDACTALLGVDRAMRYRRRTPPFAYPQYAFFHGEVTAGLDPGDEPGQNNKNEPMMCRNASCTKGTAMLEACTVHVDCRIVFRKHCGRGGDDAGLDSQDALDRLWIAAAWRRPWRQAAWLWLDEPGQADRRISVDRVARASIAAGHGQEQEGGQEPDLSSLLRGLTRLPPELVDIVLQNSADSQVWRYAAVLDRGQPLAENTGQLASVPLVDVAAWERGSPVVLFGLEHAASAADHPILLLTIDARGLKSVQRLVARPAATHNRTSHTEAYTIVDQAGVRGVKIHFKYGMARLEVPKKMKGLHIWDTPTPPDVSADCRLIFSCIVPTSKFQTAPLDRCDGITLMFVYSKVAAVHIHTPATPVARFTQLALDPDAVNWVYIPIPRAAGERVLAFGARRNASHLQEAEEEMADVAAYAVEKKAEKEAKRRAKRKAKKEAQLTPMANDNEEENEQKEEKEEEQDEGDEEDEDTENDDHDRNAYVYCNANFLFRFRLAGDVSVGPMLDAPRVDTVVAARAPISLVFSIGDSELLAVAGAYDAIPRPPSPVTLAPPFGALPTREPARANDYSNFVSTAPIDTPVARITVFSDPTYGFDRGLLVEYATGAQRALGQCRVGVDETTVFDRPQCLCVRPASYDRTRPRSSHGQRHWQKCQVFYAECSADISDGHEDEDVHGEEQKKALWSCIPLGTPGCGTLELTFTGTWGRVAVSGDYGEKQAWRKKRYDLSYSRFHRR
ncbi:hypothetical protein SPBR_00261 [Sporothrix brasiliensis 5110]|uniref:Uncharacterized protein n=1 Tax=Sporothrix brasiliensis 5110 TaxID=1398154 RepID=A0A0C2FFS9_9PEZI|nr:uncharacterized protein SPBR_00261 [Sporothrix brasiliensis 5110]KIH89978.1 hypothetical protein SPBR_00261 [Sporothrix brasiliensis 5110]